MYFWRDRVQQLAYIDKNPCAKDYEAPVIEKKASKLNGNSQKKGTVIPMPKHNFNILSIGCCCLELLSEDGTAFGTASGFLWRHAGRLYLITNWHVVSGLHAFNGQHLQNGRVPKSLRVHVTLELATPMPNGDNLA